MALDKIINLLCNETVSFFSVFSSDPLFHCIVIFYTLILLYLPHQYWRIVFSPVLILTGVLLLFILRLGVIQRSEEFQKERNHVEEVEEQESIAQEENRGNREEKQGKAIELVETNSNDRIKRNSEIEFKSDVGFESKSYFEESFMEWNVKAPLEVIYEEYEGEEAEHHSNEKQEDTTIFRYPSLSRYYPESDSDSSSENGFPATGNWDSPENMSFTWDEEDREGLIEIALDGSGKKCGLEFHFEEENLIEIDISPTRQREFSDEDRHFSGEISCN
ncbi:hypothetical protein HN51_057748 [Arachis hypogaea]|uniref:Transmembrane protein n=1 Tax=Arachis hypogaea TaxID=3818 RepID=A0A444WY75_ARAHY|nr:uncharacterized protein LOC107621644 [Arachis ipaensis]XP_025684501.1 uncharacterized protein LOC112785256 [Arachis hypogaea]QHN80850.1 uncharacterized protein DS421_20g681720 [Arachis hypogaea]RYQ82369.1 hypothetical protein Ahy_B10g100952 [Arachis hypogaea]